MYYFAFCVVVFLYLYRYVALSPYIFFYLSRFLFVSLSHCFIVLLPFLLLSLRLRVSFSVYLFSCLYVYFLVYPLPFRVCVPGIDDMSPVLDRPDRQLPPALDEENAGVADIPISTQHNSLHTIRQRKIRQINNENTQKCYH